ncbi:MAG: hypothetical protein CMF54_07285 [Legionellales bacterium]|nr:hypothetical protein [Legionellales bacterium]|tara:strand:- start:47 stop:1270 length:1224 start_codon:yes stop_codon:yes gene_type:complete
MRKFSKINFCRICNSSKLYKYLSLGYQPLANSFLKKNQIKFELKYPLELCFCKKCKLSQLSVVVNPKLIFSSYDYLSSSSKALKNHYKNLVSYLEKKNKLSINSTVLDVGCNDGILLTNYSKKISNIVGIEPSDAFKRIKDKRINIINSFFDKKAAKIYLRKFKKANIITITNVLAHVHKVNELIANIKKVLDKNGKLIIEVPYILDMLKKSTFDLIYHEHLSYFNIHSLRYLLEKNNLRIIDLKKINFGASGPSLRVVASHKNNDFEENKNIKKLIKLEKLQKIDQFNTYLKFSHNVNKKIYKLRNKLLNLHKKKNLLACYTAPAKGNTLLNALKLKKDLFEFVTENNSRKLNKYTPGTHLKIVSDNKLIKLKIKYALLLSWNYKKFFLKNSEFIKKGGKFIYPFS